MINKYSKKQELSYAFGVSPTIELLEQRAGDVERVIMSPKGTKNSGVSKIVELCKKLDIPTETNQRLVEKLASSENTYAVAIFKKYTTKLNPENNHVVLVNPSDMGNLGTICRTMLAFDFTDLAIIKPAVDIFDPKVIRASMGAMFGLRFEYFASFDEYQSKFKNNIYTLMSDGKTLVGEATFKEPYSLVFGNEGEGLSQEFKKVGESIKIPQSSKVDSFNLAVAVGISLFKAREKIN